MIAIRVLTHNNVALAGELEGIGKQIEHDLFPHAPVHIYRLGQCGTIYDQVETGLLDRGAKYAGKTGGQRRQISRTVNSLSSPGLNSRKVQQRVHQFEKAQTVTVGNRE